MSRWMGWDELINVRVGGRWMDEGWMNEFMNGWMDEWRG